MIPSTGSGDRLRFTIVTVCLNAGADLAVTVASVLRQSEDFELLIKDGGSADNPEVKRTHDPRIRYHRCPDRGIYDAMNQALALARGEFVCFLNAGDVFPDPDVLRDVGAVVAADPDIDFFYGDVQKPGSRSGFELYPRNLSRFFLFTRTICHQGWFVRRSTYLRHGGFSLEAGAGADYVLMLNMLGGDRVPYRHVGRLVAIYKGGGYSTNPAAVADIERAANLARRAVFGPMAFQFYRWMWRSWLALKPLVYDHFLVFPWRMWQRYRLHRRGTAPAQ